MSVLALALIVLWPQAAPAKAPDRTAEPALRRLFKDYHDLKSFYARVVTETRDDDGGPWQAGAALDIWYAASGGFNFYYQGMWGDGKRVISDGKCVMIDPLDDDGAFVLRDPGKALEESAREFALGGDAPTPLIYFLEGEPGFTALVDKDSSIIEKSWPDGGKSVEFNTAKLGLVDVFYQEQSPSWRITKIEYDNLPILKKKAPLEAMPDGAATTRQTVIDDAVNEAIPASTFDPTIPVGKRVEDQRKKKS